MIKCGKRSVYVLSGFEKTEIEKISEYLQRRIAGV